MHELTRSDDGEAVMSRSAYDHLVTRNRVNVLRPGKGLGSYALIEYRSLPERFRIRFEEKYGDPEKTMKQDEMPLAMDAEAQRFYHDHLLPSGEHLPEEKQTEYTTNARVLNALLEMFNTQKAMRRARNNNTPGRLVEYLRRRRGAARCLRTHTPKKRGPPARQTPTVPQGGLRLPRVG